MRSPARAPVLGNQVDVLDDHQGRVEFARDRAGLGDPLNGCSADQHGGELRQLAQQVVDHVGLTGPGGSEQQDPALEVLFVGAQELAMFSDPRDLTFDLLQQPVGQDDFVTRDLLRVVESQRPDAMGKGVCTHRHHAPTEYIALGHECLEALKEVLRVLPVGGGDLQCRWAVKVIGIPAPQPQHHGRTVNSRLQHDHRRGQAGEILAATDRHRPVVDRTHLVVAVGQQLREVPIEPADPRDADDRERPDLFLDAVKGQLDVRQFERRVVPRHDGKPRRVHPERFLETAQERLVGLAGLLHDLAQELLEQHTELIDV